MLFKARGQHLPPVRIVFKASLIRKGERATPFFNKSPPIPPPETSPANDGRKGVTIKSLFKYQLVIRELDTNVKEVIVVIYLSYTCYMLLYISDAQKF